MKHQSTPARVMLLLNELRRKGLEPGHKRIQAVFADYPPEAEMNWQDVSRRLERLVAEPLSDQYGSAAFGPITQESCASSAE